MFVVGVNQVAILKLEDVTKRTAEAGRGGGGAGNAALQAGFAALSDSTAPCCHGADLRGALARRRVARRRHRPHGRRRHQGGRHRRQGPDAAGLEHHRAGADRRSSRYLANSSPTAGRGARRIRPRRVPAGTFPPGTVVGQRRRAAAAASAARARTVLPGRRRQRRQHAVSGRREGRAAESLHDRLRRPRVVHQAAVHHADGVRPQHRRDQVAGAQRRSPPHAGALAVRRIPAASAPATASSSPRAAWCSTPATTARCARTTKTRARCSGQAPSRGAPAAFR